MFTWMKMENIALKSDLRNLYGGSSGGTKTVLPVYATSGDNSITAIADKYRCTDYCAASSGISGSSNISAGRESL